MITQVPSVGCPPKTESSDKPSGHPALVEFGSVLGLDYNNNCYIIVKVRADELLQARRARSRSQKRVADRLGVSQAYVSMLETGRRPLTHGLSRKLSKELRLPPTSLPLPSPADTTLAQDPQVMAELLAGLGYPGFSHLRTKRQKRNPAEVLLAGLAQKNLEARAVEALPWLLLHFPEMDHDWLVREAKFLEVQNRLGFVVSLARRVLKGTSETDSRVEALKKLEEQLDHCRLAREDTLCHESMTAGEAQWLRDRRDEFARHWNLVTDWRPEFLRYVA